MIDRDNSDPGWHPGLADGPENDSPSLSKAALQTRPHAMAH